MEFYRLIFLLFFVNKVLVKLQKSGLGCHIAGMCYNAFMYADDLLLLTISLCDLQLMVNICLNEFNDLDLKINVKKSVCMRIGRKHNERIDAVVIDNVSLEWKQEIRYLGIYFVSAKSFKCNLQNARQNFFVALNGIFSKIGTKSPPG